MLALLAGNVLPASAQTPDSGMLALGADLGAFFPDEAFENAFTIDAFGELYITPRISGRAMLAWTSPGGVNQRAEDHFRQYKLLFNGVYNWEMGAWHPFATAGAGAYFVRLLLDDRPDPEGETRGGLNLGGGIEVLHNLHDDDQSGDSVGHRERSAGFARRDGSFPHFRRQTLFLKPFQ